MYESAKSTTAVAGSPRCHLGDALSAVGQSGSSALAAAEKHLQSPQSTLWSISWAVRPLLTAFATFDLAEASAYRPMCLR